MNLNYLDIFVTISTDKIELMVDFYSQLLHQQPIVCRLPVYAEFQLEKLRLALFHAKPERQAEFRNHSSSMSLCLEVKDLVQAIARISDLGYPPPGVIMEASHGREIYAYDPGGNRLILHESIKK